MRPNDLRKLMLTEPKHLRIAMLSCTQLALYKRVKARGSTGVTTSELSAVLAISPQNASTQLSKMYMKGYFARREQMQESGGMEYLYTAHTFK